MTAGEQVDATLQIIAQWVPEGSRVLDLGCGDGAMLAHLQQHRHCTGYGIEIADANVLACVQRGVNVIQLNLASMWFCKLTPCNTFAMLKSCCLKPCGWGVLALWLTPTLPIGPTGSVCCADECPLPLACPTNGMTHPTFASEPTPI